MIRWKEDKIDGFLWWIDDNIIVSCDKCCIGEISIKEKDVEDINICDDCLKEFFQRAYFSREEGKSLFKTYKENAIFRRENKHFILHGVENMQEVNRIIQHGNICMM